MMMQLGHDVSALGVARLYRDICSAFVMDETDADQSQDVAEMGMNPVVCPTVMRSLEDKEHLARVTHCAKRARVREGHPHSGEAVSGFEDSARIAFFR